MRKYLVLIMTRQDCGHDALHELTL